MQAGGLTTCAATQLTASYPAPHVARVRCGSTMQEVSGAEANRSCRCEYLIRSHIHAHSGMLTQALSTLPAMQVIATSVTGHLRSIRRNQGL